MTLLEKFKSRYAPSPNSDTIGIEYFRQQLLFYLLLCCLCMGFSAYLPSVYFAFQHKLYGIVFIDTFTIALFAFLLFYKDLTYQIKAVSLLLMLYFLGLWLLLAVGPMGAGFLWLLMFGIMTGVLLGIKATFISLGINTVLFCIIGFLAYHKQIPWSKTLEDAIALYIIGGASFICINAIVAVSVAIFLGKLDSLFNREKQVTLKLKHEIQSRIQAEQENERLANTILQTQKMEALGTLAGGVAHDFNNILSSILGNAELTQLDLDNKDPLHGNINNIIISCDRAKDIVHQILTFSRHTNSAKEPCNIKAITNECAKLFQIGIPANIKFKTTTQIDDEFILGDHSQIYQVIMNLCTNAMHAIDKQHGEIHLSLLKEVITPKDELSAILDPCEYLKLTIKDTGCGIDKERLSRIFEPYFTTKNIGKGTGMGLAISHGIIRNHNGEILVSSEPGRGTVFSVYLPIYKMTKTTPQVEVKMASNGNERILFVDDEQSLLKVGEKYLTKIGYHVTTQFNPIVALDMFKSYPNSYDIVITDMKMPEMSGDVFRTKIKEIRPDIPIILCSGFADSTTNSEFDKVLTKPVKFDKLSQSIRSLMAIKN